MVESEHPEYIEARRWLIFTDFIDSNEAAEDGSIDFYCDAFYDEDESGSREVGLITGVTESG